MKDLRQMVIEGAELVVDGPALRAVRATLRALERAKNPRAKNTQKAYAVAWERYGRWCDTVHVEPFPVTPVQLIGHLEWLSETHAPATVRQAMSAIASVDRDGRLTPYDTNPQSIATHYLVRRWYDEWARENPIAPRRRAAVVNSGELWRVLDAINDPTPRCAPRAHVTRATRDKAFLLVGLWGAYRVSEIVALRVEHIEVTDRGLQVLTSTSKNNQAGAAQYTNLHPSGVQALCPVLAWQAWLRARGDWPGPAFVGIGRDGTLHTQALHKRTMEKAIKDYALRAGVALLERDGKNETRVSSHSMRRTLATVSRENGARVEDIMRHGRWRSLQTVLGYCDPVDKWRGNPTAGLFDGGDR